MNKKIIATLALSATLTLPTAVMAKVVGQCGTCHTMHNSQGNTPMAFTYDTTTNALIADADPNGSLLMYGCVGCHTGENVTNGTVPYVFDTTAPTYGTNTLAGGNFYWVRGDQTTGHNVALITGADTVLTTAPGGTQTAQVTCAGTNGCHGDQYGVVGADQFGSIAGGHHGTGGTQVGTDTTKSYVPGTAGDMANSFRMLDGIAGIEDNDWEMTKGAGDHNIYYGVDRTTEADTAGTISSLCGKCHGDFHSGAGNIGASGMSSPWVRHPTDFDMGKLATDSEYKGYTGYNIDAPVASKNVATLTSIDDTLAKGGVGSVAATGDAIVNCLSCHRAHGSEYSDLLRWNYTTISAGTTNANGCFICHTTKDDGI